MTEFLIVNSLVQSLKLEKILLDKRSLIELLNQKLIYKMRFIPKTFRDKQVKISLINGMIITLNKYITILVNISRTKAMFKV